LALTI